MSNTKTDNLLSYSTIVSAAHGDIEAVNALLKHYEGYIACLSLRQSYDDKGNPYMCVDDALRRRLETKLITKILTFRTS